MFVSLGAFVRLFVLPVWEWSLLLHRAFELTSPDAWRNRLVCPTRTRLLTHRVFSRRNPSWQFFFPHCKGNFVPLPVWPVKPSTLARAPRLPDSAGPFWHIHAVMLGCTLAGMAAFRYTWISIVSSTLGMCSSSIFLLYIPPHIHHSLSSLFVFRASVPTTSRQPLHPPNPFSAFSCFTEPR